MKKLILPLLLVVSVTGMAQRKQNVYFIAKDGRHVDLKDSAETIRVVQEPDSGSHDYNVLEYYAQSGHRKMVGRSSVIEPLMLQGSCLSYYDNGKKKSVAEYRSNIKRGTEYIYYPNGRLYLTKTYSEPDTTGEHEDLRPQIERVISSFDSTGKAQVTDGNGYYIGYEGDNFKTVFEEGNVKDGLKVGDWKGHADKGNVTFAETYKDGILITGHAKDEDGEYNYKTRNVPAQYPGGMDGFFNYLGHKIRYPMPELINNIQGKVILSFIVTRNGTVKDIKVLQGVSDNIDAEATRVISESQWMPGMAFGRQVEYLYTVPITFTQVSK